MAAAKLRNIVTNKEPLNPKGFPFAYLVLIFNHGRHG